MAFLAKSIVLVHLSMQRIVGTSAPDSMTSIALSEVAEEEEDEEEDEEEELA